MDNTFLVEEDYPAGTKLLVYNGEDENGNIQTFPRILNETTHLIPPRYYLGRRIEAIDLSEIHDNETRERIENKRAMAWQEEQTLGTLRRRLNALGRRINDNNNMDPVAVPARMDDNAIPLGRVFVPAGGSPGYRLSQRTPQGSALLSDNARERQYQEYQASIERQRAENTAFIRRAQVRRRDGVFQERQRDRARRGIYDNNNSDPNAPPPMRMDDDVPIGRVLVPQGGRKSRRGRKSKKSRKRRSRRRGRR
jgi:hypothetical protein